MNEKILKHYKLIYKAMNDLHCNYKDEDDYFFNGLIGLYNAIETYNPSKGIESTYYYTCIKNEIVKYFNYKSRNKRNIRKYEISINTPLSDTHTIEDTLVSDTDLENGLLKQERIEILHKAINKLKNKAYMTLLLEFYGINQEPMKIREIALKHHKQEHNVRRTIHRGLDNLRKIIEEEYEREN